MAEASIACIRDSALSEGINEARAADSKKDGAGKETKKSNPSASTAQSSSDGEHEHPPLSRMRLSVILGSLWIRHENLQVLVIVNVIDATVVFAVVKASDERSQKASHRHIDLVGMITLSGAVVLFEFGLNRGSTDLIWAAASIIAPLSVAATCFGIFSFWEVRHAKNPGIRPRPSSSGALD